MLLQRVAQICCRNVKNVHTSNAFQLRDNACLGCSPVTAHNKGVTSSLLLPAFEIQQQSQRKRSAQIAVAPIKNYTSSETHNALNSCVYLRDKPHSFACRWKTKNHTRMFFLNIRIQLLCLVRAYSASLAYLHVCSSWPPQFFQKSISLTFDLLQAAYAGKAPRGRSVRLHNAHHLQIRRQEN